VGPARIPIEFWKTFGAETLDVLDLFFQKISSANKND
jgi:hypothetical protein